MDDRRERAPKGAARSRSEATEREYARRAKRFLEWLKSRSMPADWRGLVLAYEALVRDLAPSSRRQYRAALRWWCEQRLSEEAALLFTARVAEIDRQWRAAQRAEGSRRRKGGGLLRQMPEETRRKIANGLYGLGTVYGLVAGDLVLATPVVGLRPKEWAEATLEGDTLSVVNAKFKEGVRANGRLRVLRMDRAKMAADEQQAIARLVLYMAGRSWNSIRPNLSPLFKQVIAGLVAAGEIEARWKRLRFYDARHQFSAELKADLDATKGEVAAAMGHASAMTAVHHYGRRRRAERPSAVRPTAESVAAVKKTTIERLTRISAKRTSRNAATAAGSAPEKPPTGDDAAGRTGKTEK